MAALWEANGTTVYVAGTHMPVAKCGGIGSNSKAAADRAVRIARVPAMESALTKAEDFIAGFEDDESQEGIADLLAEIRAARGAA